VVEDAPSGVWAGKAAGSQVLGVIGTHTLAQLHDADLVVRSLEGVVATPHDHRLDLRFVAEKR
jgi:sugar-phosphatase